MWRALALLFVGAALLFSRRAAAAEPEGLRMTGEGGIRGLRNNNPFNLRPSRDFTWQGQLGADEGNYLIFDSAASGLRAGYINIRNQQRKHHLATVRQIITKYAPPEDNNKTEAYIAAVSRALDVGPDDALNLITDLTRLTDFGRAVIKHENGVQPYSELELHTAAQRAIQQ